MKNKSTKILIGISILIVVLIILFTSIEKSPNEEILKEKQQYLGKLYQSGKEFAEALNHES